MVLLMLTTSVAVLVYFLRHREQAGRRVWQTKIAPALACIGLVASLWLVLSNFTLVTGGSAALSTALAAVPFLGLLIGCLVGQPERLQLFRHGVTPGAITALEGPRMSTILMMSALQSCQKHAGHARPLRVRSGRNSE